MTGTIVDACPMGFAHSARLPLRSHRHNLHRDAEDKFVADKMTAGGHRDLVFEREAFGARGAASTR
jgi:hypothetical protein